MFVHLWPFLGLLAYGERLEEPEKPHLLKVVAKESSRPQHGLELRVLQRHGRAPVPPEPRHVPNSEAEIMQEFDEVIVEWKTSLYVSSVLLRLPEKQDGLAASGFDGYKFFTGPKDECKFHLSEQNVLPDEATQVARDLAGMAEISSCEVTNRDLPNAPRRSTALLKFHLHPFEHNESGWRYFSVMIRNPQKTPDRSSMDGQLANTFQLVMNLSTGETVAKMAFQALEIKPIWVCSYTPWLVTTPCTAECGGGFRTRVRRMIHPPEQGHDPKLLKRCHENLEEHEPCNLQVCDVDCQLSEWSGWAQGACSRSCGGGTMVQRRTVVMGPKGHGRICAPWHDASRMRAVECNTAPCPDSCTASPLMAEHPQVPPFTIFGDVPRKSEKEDEKDEQEDETPESYQSSVKSLPKTNPSAETTKSKGPKQQAQEAHQEPREVEQQAKETQEPREVEQQAEEAQEQPGREVQKHNSLRKSESEDEEAEVQNPPGEGENPADEGENPADEGQTPSESLLSLREAPALVLGATKSSCSEPCGGGKRLVLLPSLRKVGEKSCHMAFEEDCNKFACQPLMMQPAKPWQLPVKGQWFMVEIAFIVEELAQSLRLRAPPEFLLGATGQSECFLVEHSLPNLESCTVHEGDSTKNLGPMMVMQFSNGLEPQNSYTMKRDWYYLQTWVQHPENCTGGEADGKCLGLEGERQWVLSLSMSEPNGLWDVVKGSYDFFVDAPAAETALRLNVAGDLSLPDALVPDTEDQQDQQEKQDKQDKDTDA